MARILVIADDLTGANATGARFARSGLRVATVGPEHAARAAEEYDVVVVDLNSRHLPAARAAALVAQVVGSVPPVPLVVKRTDTTLRGNVGAELEAAWHAVRERVPAGTRVRALFAPAFPESGRVTVNGLQLLDGVPLEQTELAHDPLTLADSSVVTDIIARQSRLEVRRVSIGEVTGPRLADRLAAGTEPVVLCDAFTEQHLGGLARAAAEVQQRDGTVWVAADPGPCGALLAEALGLSGRGTVKAGPLLAVVGSATSLTRRQLDSVERAGSARFVDVDARALTDDSSDYADGLRERLAKRLAEAAFPETVVVRTASADHDVLDLPFEAKRALPRRLAALVTRAVLDSPVRIGGLYTSGGDVTTAVLDALGAHAFEVSGEVVPLAVHGHLAGGPLDGTAVVTKGGLVGADDSVVECLSWLREAVRARARTLPAALGRDRPAAEAPTVLPQEHRDAGPDSTSGGYGARDSSPAGCRSEAPRPRKGGNPT